MRNCLKTVLALLCLSFTIEFAPATASASTSCHTRTLTAAQCVTVRQALAQYIAFITKIFGANSPIGKELITLAQNDTNKVCPLPGNGWTADTENECTVLSPDHTAAVSLGLDASGNLTNSGTPVKVVCVSTNACSTMVATKFNTFGPTLSQRCSDPNDMTVQHLTDVQVQAKINALP